MEFEQKVSSIHHFEHKNKNYLAVSYESCELRMFVFIGDSFKILSLKSDFVVVKKWITMTFKRNLYLFTIGKAGCGRNTGNLWSFSKHQLQVEITNFIR